MVESLAPSSSRTLDLPASEYGVPARQRYTVTAMTFDDEVAIGVMAPVDVDHTIDDYPDPIQVELEHLAEHILDWSRLASATTDDELPRVGRLVLSRLDDERVEMTVDWEPNFVA